MLGGVEVLRRPTERKAAGADVSDDPVPRRAGSVRDAG
jgi:hypothetical protein